MAGVACAEGATADKAAVRAVSQSDSQSGSKEEDFMLFDLDACEAIQQELARCGRCFTPRLQLLCQWGSVPSVTLAAFR